jgi:hypothetical protein
MDLQGECRTNPYVSAPARAVDTADSFMSEGIFPQSQTS